MTDMSQFKLRAEDFRYVGAGLSRPESIIAERDGTLWVSDDRGAVTRIDPDGRQTLLGAARGAPNGAAMDRNGVLYVANIGDGKLYRLARDGTEEVLLDKLDGAPLGAVNFVYVDSHDRIWVTISTLTVPRHDAIAKPRPDGYILCIGKSGPVRAASGFCFTNEVRIDPAERHLYVAETAASRIVRLPLSLDGSLGKSEPFGPDPVYPGARVDGIAFDAAGNLWVTELSRNALLMIQPDGKLHTVFEDPEGKILLTPSSLTFAGEDLSSAYVGSIKLDKLACFRSPVPGAPLAHWTRSAR